MNADEAVLIAQRAERQAHNGFCFCHVTAHQVEGLAKGYIDLRRRLGAIHELAQRGLLALADHHVCECHDPNVKDILGEILELSKCV